MRHDESSSHSSPLHIFCSYAQEDESLLEELEKHLSIVKRQGYITAWAKRNISAGREWLHEINKNLNTADIILLIISADFIASDYCYGIEMQRALVRHEAQDARVIPIILRPVDWKGAPFTHLEALPTGTKPVTSREWHNQDEAFADIVQGIRQVVDELRTVQIKKWPHQEQPNSQDNWPEMSPSTFKPEPTLHATDENITYSIPILVPPLPTFDPQWLKELDASGGAVALDSQFYVERQVDAEAKEQLLRLGVTIRIKGSRQTGKTSLLARLLQHADNNNYPFFYLDFQELDHYHLNSLDTFLYYFTYRMATELDTHQKHDHYWREEKKLTGSKDRLTAFLRQEVLEQLTTCPFTLFLDEVDLLFACGWRAIFLA